MRTGHRLRVYSGYDSPRIRLVALNGLYIWCSESTEFAYLAIGEKNDDVALYVIDGTAREDGDLLKDIEEIVLAHRTAGRTICVQTPYQFHKGLQEQLDKMMGVKVLA